MGEGFYSSIMDLVRRLQAPGVQGCRSREEVLWSYAAGTLDDRERARLEAHLATCARCRQSIAACRQVSDGLHSERTRPQPASQTDWDALRARLEENQPSGVQAPDFEGSGRRWRPIPGFAVATAVLCCIVGVRTMSPGRSPHSDSAYSVHEQEMVHSSRQPAKSLPISQDRTQMELTPVQKPDLVSRSYAHEGGATASIAGNRSKDRMTNRASRRIAAQDLHPLPDTGRRHKGILIASREVLDGNREDLQARIGGESEQRGPDFVLTSVGDGEEGSRRYVMDRLSSDDSGTSNGRTLASDVASSGAEGEMRELQGW